jgi:hypothetical protein
MDGTGGTRGEKVKCMQNIGWKTRRKEVVDDGIIYLKSLKKRDWIVGGGGLYCIFLNLGKSGGLL